MVPVEAHLALNHVPLIGLVFGLLFFVGGLMRSSESALRIGLRIFLAMGATVLPVVGSGLVSAPSSQTPPGLMPTRPYGPRISAEPCGTASSPAIGLVQWNRWAVDDARNQSQPSCESLLGSLLRICINTVDRKAWFV
jgi:hypothetical protein